MAQNWSEFNESAFIRANRGEQRVANAPLLASIYGALFVSGFLGNAGTVFAIGRAKYLHTPTNLYLLNLSIADFIVVLLGIPVEIYTSLERYPWRLGLIACKLQTGFKELSIYLSVFTVVVFSFERYMAICHPFYTFRASKSRAHRPIAAIWFMGVIHALPCTLLTSIDPLDYPTDINYGQSSTADLFRARSSIPNTGICRIPLTREYTLAQFYHYYSALVSFVVPFALLIVFYSRMGLRQATASGEQRLELMLKQRRALDSVDDTDNGLPLTDPASTAQLLARHGEKAGKDADTSHHHTGVLRKLAVVVVCFMICQGNYQVQRLFAVTLDWTSVVASSEEPLLIRIYSVGSFCAVIFRFLHPTLNPIVYALHCQHFRRALREEVFLMPSASSGVVTDS